MTTVRIEISDIEFEENLEKVWMAWEGGVDTFDIGLMCGISEAKADYILSCYLEGKFHQMEEARFVLKQYPAFDPASYVA